MLAEGLVRVGNWLSRERPAGSVEYWRRTMWSRQEWEGHPVLGVHYREERKRLERCIGDAVEALRAAEGRRLVGVDLCAGTGIFSEALLSHGVKPVVSVDVSPIALDACRLRLGHCAAWQGQRADVTEGGAEDVRRRIGVGGFDVIVCVDALHHLAKPEESLAAVEQFGVPGARLIGNFWTADRFHEFSRSRRGTFGHLRASTAYALGGLSVRLGGRQPEAVRSCLWPAASLCELLKARYQTVAITESRYWVTFVAELGGGRSVGDEDSARVSEAPWA